MFIDIGGIVEQAMIFIIILLIISILISVLLRKSILSRILEGKSTSIKLLINTLYFIFMNLIILSVFIGILWMIFLQ